MVQQIPGQPIEGHFSRNLGKYVTGLFVAVILGGGIHYHKKSVDEAVDKAKHLPTEEKIGADYIITTANSLKKNTVEDLLDKPYVKEIITKSEKEYNEQFRQLQDYFFKNSKKLDELVLPDNIKQALAHFREEYGKGHFEASYDTEVGRCFFFIDINGDFRITKKLDLDNDGVPDCDVDALSEVKISLDSVLGSDALTTFTVYKKYEFPATFQKQTSTTEAIDRIRLKNKIL